MKKVIKMRKLLSFLSILFFGVLTSACVYTFAVNELNQIALEYLKNGDPYSAISRLESSIDLDDSKYESRYNLAVAYLRTNQCEKALENAKVADSLIKDEPAVKYTLGVAYTCVADELYEKKNSDGEIEKKEYPDPTLALDIAKKYVNYLEEGNKSLDIYTKLMPNAQDIPDVLNMISQNNERIQSKKAEFSIQ